MKKLACISLAVFVSSCASIAVTSNNIEERTAFALGLNSTEFTISNRRDSGLRTDYLVKTNKGRQYNCYVEGTFSFTGKTLTDAVCNPAGSSRQPVASTTNCNALLKAAGRC